MLHGGADDEDSDDTRPGTPIDMSYFDIDDYIYGADITYTGQITYIRELDPSLFDTKEDFKALATERAQLTDEVEKENKLRKVLIKKHNARHIIDKHKALPSGVSMTLKKAAEKWDRSKTRLAEIKNDPFIVIYKKTNSAYVYDFTNTNIGILYDSINHSLYFILPPHRKYTDTASVKKILKELVQHINRYVNATSTPDVEDDTLTTLKKRITSYSRDKKIDIQTLSTSNQCFNFNITTIQTHIETLNEKLAEACISDFPFSLNVEYHYKYTDMNQVTSFSPIDTYKLLLCLNYKNKCVSSINLNYYNGGEGENLIEISTSTMERYTGRKFNKILTAISILVSSLIICNPSTSKSIDKIISIAIVPISAYLLMKYFNVNYTISYDASEVDASSDEYMDIISGPGSDDPDEAKGVFETFRAGRPLWEAINEYYKSGHSFLLEIPLDDDNFRRATKLFNTIIDSKQLGCIEYDFQDEEDDIDIDDIDDIDKLQKKEKLELKKMQQDLLRSVATK